MFARAGQPELVRSNQKDVYYLGFLREGVGQIYRNFRGLFCQFHYLNIHICPSISFAGYLFNSNEYMKGHIFELRRKIYMLFTGFGSVRIVKNCDLRPRAAFSSPRSQFFTIRTDPKPVNNLFIFFLL